MPRTTFISCLTATALLASPIHAESVSDAAAMAVEAFSAALRGDDTALTPVFDAQGAWMPSTGGRFQGHAAIAKALAGYPDVQDFEVSFSEELPLGDEYIFHQGTFAVTLPAAAGGATKSGEFIVVSKVTPEGLQMIRHISFAPRGQAAK